MSDPSAILADPDTYPTLGNANVAFPMPILLRLAPNVAPLTPIP